MSDKLIAGAVTALGVVPICAVCILGPAAVGSMVAGAFGWIGGLGPVLTTGLAIIFGYFIYGIVRRRKPLALGQETNAPCQAPAVSNQTKRHSESSSAAASFLQPSYSDVPRPDAVGGDQK